MSIITTGKNVQNNIYSTSQIIKNGCKTNKLFVNLFCLDFTLNIVL